MLLHDLEGLVNAFLDRHGRHHHDELRESKAPVQLEDGSQVHVGLARSRLHLDGEFPGRQSSGWGQAIAQLHRVQVGQQFIVQEGQAIADAKVVLRKAHARLLVRGVHRHRELGAANFLAPEQVADRFDGLELVVKARLEVEFHWGSSEMAW